MFPKERLQVLSIDVPIFPVIDTVECELQIKRFRALNLLL